jgi:hypothetical protein
MPLRSETTIAVRGKRPERLLNIAADAGVEVRLTSKHSDTELLITAPFALSGELTKFADIAGLDAETLKNKGVLPFADRFRHRIALWIAPIVVIFAVLYLSCFVWEVSVSGNERVADGEILRVLDECGFGVGSYGPETDCRLLANDALAKLEELSFLAVNITGSRAEIVVRERINPPPPTKLEPPSSQFRQIIISMPTEYTSKRFTGKEFSKNSLILGNFRINLHFPSSNLPTTCDIIVENHRLTIFGFAFPFALEQSKVRLWEPESRRLTVDEAAAVLQRRAESKTDGLNVLNSTFTVSEADGLVILTKNIEVLE